VDDGVDDGGWVHGAAALERPPRPTRMRAPGSFARALQLHRAWTKGALARGIDQWRSRATQMQPPRGTGRFGRQLGAGAAADRATQAAALWLLCWRWHVVGSAGLTVSPHFGWGLACVQTGAPCHGRRHAHGEARDVLGRLYSSRPLGKPSDVPIFLLQPDLKSCLAKRAQSC